MVSQYGLVARMSLWTVKSIEEAELIAYSSVEELAHRNWVVAHISPYLSEGYFDLLCASGGCLLYIIRRPVVPSSTIYIVASTMLFVTLS